MVISWEKFALAENAEFAEYFLYLFLTDNRDNTDFLIALAEIAEFFIIISQRFLYLFLTDNRDNTDFLIAVAENGEMGEYFYCILFTREQLSFIYYSKSEFFLSVHSVLSVLSVSQVQHNFFCEFPVFCEKKIIPIIFYLCILCYLWAKSNIFFCEFSVFCEKVFIRNNIYLEDKKSP